jgi:hypothetical protein
VTLYPTADASIPTADASIPTADASIPTADASIPTADALKAVHALADDKGVRCIETRTSWFMKAIYWVGFLWIWNPDFLETTTLTMGRRIYMPHTVVGPDTQDRWLRTICHELIHVDQYRRLTTPGFLLAYGFPQVLSLAALGAIWGPLWWLLALGFLAPWPAPFRLRLELEAFAMSELVRESQGKVQGSRIYQDKLTGWAYYRASWNREAVGVWYSRLKFDSRQGTIWDRRRIYREIRDVVLDLRTDTA